MSQYTPTDREIDDLAEKLLNTTVDMVMGSQEREPSRDINHVISVGLGSLAPQTRLWPERKRRALLDCTIQLFAQVDADVFPHIEEVWAYFNSSDINPLFNLPRTPKLSHSLGERPVFRGLAHAANYFDQANKSGEFSGLQLEQTAAELRDFSILIQKLIYPMSTFENYQRYLSRLSRSGTTSAISSPYEGIIGELKGTIEKVYHEAGWLEISREANEFFSGTTLTDGLPDILSQIKKEGRSSNSLLTSLPALVTTKSEREFVDADALTIRALKESIRTAREEDEKRHLRAEQERSQARSPDQLFKEMEQSVRLANAQERSTRLALNDITREKQQYQEKLVNAVQAMESPLEDLRKALSWKAEDERISVIRKELQEGERATISSLYEQAENAYRQAAEYESQAAKIDEKHPEGDLATRLSQAKGFHAEAEKARKIAESAQEQIRQLKERIRQIDPKTTDYEKQINPYVDQYHSFKKKKDRLEKAKCGEQQKALKTIKDDLLGSYDKVIKSAEDVIKAEHSIQSLNQSVARFTPYLDTRSATEPQLTSLIQAVRQHIENTRREYAVKVQQTLDRSLELEQQLSDQLISGCFKLINQSAQWALEAKQIAETAGVQARNYQTMGLWARNESDTADDHTELSKLFGNVADTAATAQRHFNLAVEQAQSVIGRADEMAQKIPDVNAKLTLPEAQEHFSSLFTLSQAAESALKEAHEKFQKGEKSGIEAGGNRQRAISVQAAAPVMKSVDGPARRLTEEGKRKLEESVDPYLRRL